MTTSDTQFWRDVWRGTFGKAEPRIKPPPSRYDVSIWKAAFAEHPDREYVQWLINGLTEGFHIGYTGSRPHGRPRNLPTNNFEKLEIVKWLAKGYEQGYILGPFTRDECPIDTVISPVGAVPKPPDKCRMIHHLSAAQGAGTLSVNDVIQEEMKRITYITTREVVRIADAVGQGGYLWTVDAQDAYVRVPIHPSEWGLLGIKFNGRIFIMTCLPFGLASSCRIYERFADGIEWVVVHTNRKDAVLPVNGEVIQLIRHYLDDFIGGHPDMQAALRQFLALINWFEILQVPTQIRKCSGPATRQKILGSLYDTILRQIILPSDKATAYRKAVQKALRQARVTKQELQSLGGKLRFAARHIWCGASFCRRLEWTYSKLRRGSHRTRLNRMIRADLQWWTDILEDLKEGIPFDWILRPRQACTWTIWTDACRTEEGAGFGGLSSDGRWFQFKVTKERFSGRVPDINWCELAAVVVALRLWGPSHPCESVHLYCDNAPAVGQMAKQSATAARPDIFALIRSALRYSAKHKFHYWIDHIKGDDNDPADALSRFYKDPLAGVERLCPDLRPRMEASADNCDSLFEEYFDTYEREASFVRVTTKIRIHTS